MKVFWLILSLFCFGTLLFSGVYRCNDYYYGKDGAYTKQKKQCISEKTLQGCEHAGAVLEQQLRECDWTLTRCVEANNECVYLYQELKKQKGEK